MTMATDKQIKTAILEILKEEENTRSLKIKKLRKKVLKYLINEYNHDYNKENDKKWDAKFESILQEMELGKKIAIKDETVTKLSKKRNQTEESRSHINLCFQSMLQLSMAL